MYRYTILIISILLPISLIAQTKLSHFELGASIGGMNYIGDLNHSSVLGRPEIGGGVMIRYNINDRWSVTATGGYGHIQGGNPDVEALRNLSFRSRIWEVGVRAEFNFIALGTKGVRLPFSPYLFCGAAFFSHNPTTQYLDPKTGETIIVDLQPLGTEGQGMANYPERTPYSLAQIALPFGIGVKWMVTDFMTLGAEYGLRKTWTDYLDDVSKTYVGKQAFGDATAAALSDRSGEVEKNHEYAAGTLRGDETLDDWYTYFNINITFNMETLFGWMRSNKCEIK